MIERWIPGSLLASAALVTAPALGGQFDNRRCSVASISDLDGDGIGDVIVANRAPGARECVWAISVKSGRVLHRIEGRAAGDLFGCALADLGDLDKDGVADFAVGAAGQHVALFPERGGAWDWVRVGRAYIRLISGKSGSMLRERLADQEESMLGSCLAPAGDVDGDGVVDLLASDPWRISSIDSMGRPLFVPVVDVCSGATGELLRRLPAPAREASDFGASLALLGDVDGDSQPDWAVGAPGWIDGKPLAGSGVFPSGAVLIISAKHGAVLRTLRVSTEFNFGSNLASTTARNGKPGFLAVGSQSKTVHTWNLADWSELGIARTHSEWGIDEFGSSLALVIDHVAGEKPLLIVGANEQAPTGFFDVGYADLCGPDGKVIRALMPEDRTQGVDATAIGDFDGDQRPDYACVLVNDMRLVLIGSSEKTARREIRLLEPAASTK